MPLLVGCHSISPTRLLWPYSSSTASVMLRLRPPSGISHTRTCEHTRAHATEGLHGISSLRCVDLHPTSWPRCSRPLVKNSNRCIDAVHCIRIRLDYRPWSEAGDYLPTSGRERKRAGHVTGAFSWGKRSRGLCLCNAKSRD